jgi:hypothetical protein
MDSLCFRTALKKGKNKNSKVDVIFDKNPVVKFTKMDE